MIIHYSETEISALLILIAVLFYGMGRGSAKLAEIGLDRQRPWKIALDLALSLYFPILGIIFSITYYSDLGGTLAWWFVSVVAVLCLGCTLTNFFKNISGYKSHQNADRGETDRQIINEHLRMLEESEATLGASEDMPAASRVDYTSSERRQSRAR